jgi:hypothetical protein
MTEAQQGGSGADLAAIQRAVDQHETRQEESKAVEADRAGFVARLVDRWRGSTDDAGAELSRALPGLSTEQLLNVAAARTVTELNEAIFGREASLDGKLTPKVLGSASSDLVFFPLTPCRLIDTRLTAAGALAAGATRDFDSNGLDLSAQGGSATGCGVNDPDPAALAVTITAVAPQGPGDLRAYPAGAVAPNASVINYALPGQGLNLANTTILPLLQSGANINEFTIRADVSGAHVVADVVGYFYSPLATAVQCVTVQNSVAVANNAQIDYPPGLASGACPAGYALTGGGNRYSGDVTGFFWWNSYPDNGQWVTAGHNTTGGNVTVFVYGVCCRVPGR